jgi:hypothetical protein
VVGSSHASAQIVRLTSFSRNTVRKWSKAPVLEGPKIFSEVSGVHHRAPQVLHDQTDLRTKLVRPVCLAFAGTFDLGRLQCDIDTASRLAPID